MGLRAPSQASRVPFGRSSNARELLDQLRILLEESCQLALLGVLLAQSAFSLSSASSSSTDENRSVSVVFSTFSIRGLRHEPRRAGGEVDTGQQSSERRAVNRDLRLAQMLSDGCSKRFGTRAQMRPEYAYSCPCGQHMSCAALDEHLSPPLRISAGSNPDLGRRRFRWSLSETHSECLPAGSQTSAGGSLPSHRADHRYETGTANSVSGPSCESLFARKQPADLSSK